MSSLRSLFLGGPLLRSIVGASLWLASVPSSAVAYVPPPTYPTVHYQLGVNGEFFSGTVRRTPTDWIQRQNIPLIPLGVPVPLTACARPDELPPPPPTDRVSGELDFTPAHDHGRIITGVYDARLAISVFQGYEKINLGCWRWRPITQDREVRVRLFSNNTRVPLLTLRDIPGWGEVTAHIEWHWESGRLTP